MIVAVCVVAVAFSFSELNMIDRIESGALVGDVWKAGALPGDGGRARVLLLSWWLSWIAGTVLGARFAR